MSAPSDTRPRVRLGSYLLLLTIATLLPFLVLAAVSGIYLVRSERATFERGARERVRALNTAIDAELRSSITTLQALAQSDALRRDDFVVFREIANRVQADNPEWLSISVARADTAHQVFNLLIAPGAPLPDVLERATFDSVVQTGEPIVGNVRFDPLPQRHDFTVRVPVVHDGVLRYVLSAAVDPGVIQNMLMEQRFPLDWVATVADRMRRIVARTVEPEKNVGELVSPSLRDTLAQGADGFVPGETREGAPVYVPFVTSPYSGWTVAIGVPAAAVDASAVRLVWTVMMGVGLALAAAVLLARQLGRRLAEPIGALAERAHTIRIGGPEAGQSVQAPVWEIAQLAQTLEGAATAVSMRDATQRELSAVTTNATLALFMTDAAQRCTYMNPAAEAMTGFTLKEMQGRTLGTTLHPTQPDGAPFPGGELPLERATAAADRRQAEARFVHRSGRVYPVAYTASPIGHDGRTVGSIVEARDITDEIDARAERARLLEREQYLRAEAEAANRAKDEFLAMLGHELRNPLGAISNALHVMDLRPGSEHALRAQQVIGRQAVHLSRLVDDLLDAARVASGKIVLARAPVDVAEVARRTATVMFGSGTSHRVTLDLQPAWVDGDETRLEQVATNLIGNALRYTPQGGRIAVHTGVDGDAVMLEVRDTGIGITADLLPRVFNMFVQGNRGLERRQGGLGIGLTLVRRLVELHGGSVDAASAGIDQGSTFTVRLPHSGAPKAVAAQALPPLAASAQGRRRVLVVEDNNDVRATLGAVLELAGHDVHMCADGIQGIEAALRLRPDVALIDIGLPGTDGYETARRIRAEPFGSQILLVALTGYGQPEDRQLSLAAGFDLHEAKPVDMAALLEKIERWPAIPATS